MKRNQILYLAGGLIILVAILRLCSHHEEEPKFTPRDYPEIIESGILRAVTEYNTISYHADKDSLSGFDYELLNAFAQAKNLRLEVTPEMSFEERLKGLNKGKYDLIATETTVTTRSKDSLLFSHTLLLSKQVLVQRKPEKGKDSLYIHNQLELGHKTLHVVKGSPALLRLHNLISEIADTIYIQEIEQYGPEQLMAMVSGGDIDYAVCDENIAKANMHLYPNLDIDTDISFTQFYAWGVAKHSPILLDSLNQWLDEYICTLCCGRFQFVQSRDELFRVVANLIRTE